MTDTRDFSPADKAVLPRIIRHVKEFEMHASEGILEYLRDYTAARDAADARNALVRLIKKLDQGFIPVRMAADCFTNGGRSLASELFDESFYSLAATNNAIRDALRETANPSPPPDRKPDPQEAP